MPKKENMKDPITKELLAKLIAENPTAALEYIWELRKTLMALTKSLRQAKLDGQTAHDLVQSAIKL